MKIPITPLTALFFVGQVTVDVVVLPDHAPPGGRLQEQHGIEATVARIVDDGVKGGVTVAPPRLSPEHRV